jgi:Cu+-exporting ATPase
MTHDHQHHGKQTAIDPVCEMVVDPATARSAEVRGKTYYFCSEGCRTKFVADPDKYLNRTPFVLPPKKPAPAAATPNQRADDPIEPGAKQQHLGHAHPGHYRVHHIHTPPGG